MVLPAKDCHALHAWGDKILPTGAGVSTLQAYFKRLEKNGIVESNNWQNVLHSNGASLGYSAAEFVDRWPKTSRFILQMGQVFAEVLSLLGDAIRSHALLHGPPTPKQCPNKHFFVQSFGFAVSHCEQTCLQCKCQVEEDGRCS